MLTEQEQAQICLLSENEFYPQAVAFMKNLDKPLPQTQINGLLNVSLSCTFNELTAFVAHQSQRGTWPRGNEHIPKFYEWLVPKIEQLKRQALMIVADRAERATQEDVEALIMALVREFIQHLLGENSYKEALERAKKDENRRRPDQRGNRQGVYGGRRGEEPKKSMYKGGR